MPGAPAAPDLRAVSGSPTEPGPHAIAGYLSADCPPGSLFLEPHGRRAVELADQVGDAAIQVTTLSRLGTAEQELGDPDAAFETHHRALALLTEQTVFDPEVEVRNRLGGSLFAAGRTTAARAEFRTVLDRVDATHNPLEHARASRTRPL